MQSNESTSDIGDKFIVACKNGDLDFLKQLISRVDRESLEVNEKNALNSKFLKEKNNCPMHLNRA